MGNMLVGRRLNIHVRVFAWSVAYDIMSGYSELTVIRCHGAYFTTHTDSLAFDMTSTEMR